MGWAKTALAVRLGGGRRSAPACTSSTRSRSMGRQRDPQRHVTIGIGEAPPPPHEDDDGDRATPATTATRATSSTRRWRRRRRAMRRSADGGTALPPDSGSPAKRTVVAAQQTTDGRAPALALVLLLACRRRRRIVERDFDALASATVGKCRTGCRRLPGRAAACACGTQGEAEDLARRVAPRAMRVTLAVMSRTPVEQPNDRVDVLRVDFGRQCERQFWCRRGRLRRMSRVRADRSRRRSARRLHPGPGDCRAGRRRHDAARCPRIHGLITANWFCRKNVLLDYGGFDASLKSGGDIELSRRMFKDGLPIVYLSTAVVLHPPRIQIAEIVGKARRVVGGRWAAARGRHRLFTRMKTETKNLLQRVQKIARAKNMTFYERVEVMALLLRLWLISLAELLRLQFGGVPTRS